MADSKQTLSNRLANLHRRMEEAQVDAYLVLSSDAHLNEYVPEYTRRRTAITGFRGSAGDVLVCPDGSHLFVDSRYHIQADDEVDHDNFRVHKLGLAEEKSLSQWLTEMEKERGSIRVGFDPFVVSMRAHFRVQVSLEIPGFRPGAVQRQPGGRRMGRATAAASQSCISVAGRAHGSWRRRKAIRYP